MQILSIKTSPKTDADEVNNSYFSRGYSLLVKKKRVEKHINGIRFRVIARATGVNHNTMIN
jgi:hypothetical protein